MTNNEALHILRGLKRYYNDERYYGFYAGFDVEDNEAIDKAIKELEMVNERRTESEGKMTTEGAIKHIENIIPYVGENVKESLNMAIKALEQADVLDKIYADIQRLRGCSCNCSDGIIDDVEDILGKYKTESEG